VDAIYPGQLLDTPTCLVVGHQRLHLGPGQPPLDVTQLADVRTSRILEHRVRPHVTYLADPPEEPALQGWRPRNDSGFLIPFVKRHPATHESRKAVRIVSGWLHSQLLPCSASLHSVARTAAAIANATVAPSWARGCHCRRRTGATDAVGVTSADVREA
jgi:hypothetical protein